MIFLPLPYGSVEEWSIFIFEAMTVILFGMHLTVKFRNKKRSLPQTSLEVINGKDSLRIPAIFKIFLGIFFLVTIFQLIPLPGSLVKNLSPQTYEIHMGLSDIRNIQGLMTLSFSPALTIYELLKYICYFLFGFLVFQYVRTKTHIETFVGVLLASALFQSFYGLIEYFGKTGRIFGFKNTWSQGFAFGTFINNNHFAGFLEMLFPLSVGYLLAKADFFSMKKGLSLRDKILWFGHERLQRTIILGIIPVFLGLGIFYSRSRSGFLIFFADIFLMIIVLSLARRRKGGSAAKEKRYGTIVRTVSLVILFSAVWIGIKPILERFSGDSLERQVRPKIYRYTIDLIKDFPLSGTGPGTYVYAYPKYEPVRTPRLTDHAHDDYLEVLAESGIIGGASLIGLAFGGLGYLFVLWMKRKDYFVRGIVFGCMAGIVSLLLHSVSDFNLRLPANAVYFVVLFALGFTSVMKQRRPD